MKPQKEKPKRHLQLERSEPRYDRGKRWFVFNRSPLARKIILFNLIALGILVSGVLYLNQAQDSQVTFRSNALARQAEMISAAMNSYTDNSEISNFDAEPFLQLFDALVAHSDSIVQIYGADGSAKITYIPKVAQRGADEPDSDAVTNVLQKIWEGISSASNISTDEDNQENLEKQWAALAKDAMAANGRTKNVILSANGEMFISVALPISGPEGNVGAILISTDRGEVDSIIRGAREQILQMFLLAILSSIVLSMVLANSIARPLRRLSEAAQRAQNEAGRMINLARVNIPDLTARPDEIGDLSRSMRNMTDALLDRADENKSFAADVAHEIKNPLTSLRSAVETLGYVQDDESRHALLEVIQNDVERLDRLVTDISNASRLEGELVRDEWEQVDLSKLVSEMVGNFRQREAYKNVDLKLEINTETGIIRGLGGRLEQVFTNLIGNALSFAPETEGWVRVSINDTGADGILIEVSDNGPGIPEKNLEDIFARFYSERPVAQFGEHSGLGLAITKQIVEAHGGNIVARNTKPVGAKFSVTLPR